MSDDVIKNKNRKPIENQEHKKYVPEYIRLGVKPQDFIASSGNSSDFYCSVDSDLTDNQKYDQEEIKTIPSKPLEINDDYILMVFDEIISYGSKQEIEEKIKEILFSDNSLFDDKQIEVNDIVVFKKIKIKVGVFLND